jgi:hypothetical protein
MSRQQSGHGGKPPQAGVSAQKSATNDGTAAKPEEFPPKRWVNVTVIVSVTAIIGLLLIAAREPSAGAWGLIPIAVSIYGLTLMWDFFAILVSVYGPVSIRNIHKVLPRLLLNYYAYGFLMFFLALFGAALVLALYAPSLASSWGSLLPARSRDVSALVVSVLSGELAALAFAGWLWFRPMRKRLSRRFGYHDMTEGLGDLAWTLAMISIAFGAAGSTSNRDWLVITGVFVPVVINLQRQSYRKPRRAPT